MEDRAMTLQIPEDNIANVKRQNSETPFIRQSNGHMEFDIVMAKREAFQELHHFQKNLESNGSISEGDSGVRDEIEFEVNYSNAFSSNNIQSEQQLNEEEKKVNDKLYLENQNDLLQQQKQQKYQFDKEIVDFNNKFENQIEQHINRNAYTDRRILGSIVGMSIFGGVGFLVFSSTITFGVSGGVLGIVLGGVIGSRIKKKIDLKKLSTDQFLAFKITQIIKWTYKNQCKLNPLWQLILTEKVIIDTKILFSYADKKPAQKALTLVMQYLTSNEPLKLLEPHIPTLEEFKKQSEMEKMRTVFKTFNFFIPFLQLVELNRSQYRYKSLSVYKKIQRIVFSVELTSFMNRVILNHTDNPQEDNSQASPSAQISRDNDIQGIIKKAVFERICEPLDILENKLNQFNLKEKSSVQLDFERQNSINLLNDHNRLISANNSIIDFQAYRQQMMMVYQNENYPLQLTMYRQVPSQSPRGLFSNDDYYQGPHHLRQVFNGQMNFARGDSDAIDANSIRISGGASSSRNSQGTRNREQEERQNNSQYVLDPSDVQVDVDPLSKCNDEDFINLIRLAEDDNSTWDIASTADNVITYKKVVDGSPVVLIKAVALIKGVSPDIVEKMIFTSKIRQEWDKVISDIEIFDEGSEDGISYIYFMVKTPIGVSNRDFIWRKKVKRNFPRKDVVTMHFKSAEHPKWPPRSKNVRGECIIGGYILEKIQNADQTIDTKLVIINQNDIKGIVPKALVNMGAAKTPKQWVQNLVKGCNNYLNGVYKDN